MAQLTDTLQTEMRGKSMVDGERVAPGFLQEVAGAADNFVNNLGRTYAANQQAAADSKMDAFAGGIWEAQKAAAEQLRLPPGAEGASADLARAQTAEKQGQIPKGSFGLLLEKTVTEFFTEYPEMRAEFSKYLKDQGYDHYLFREIAATEKDALSREDNQRAAEKTFYEAAVARGADVPGDYNATVSTGRRVLQLETQQKLAADQLEIEIKRADLTERERKSLVEQSGADQTAMSIQIADTVLGPMLQKAYAMIGSAGLDPNRKQKLDQLLPLIEGNIEAFRAANLPNIPSEAGRTAFNQYIDTMKTGLTSVFNANYESNKRTLDTIQTNLAIDSQQSFQVYNKLTSTFGQNFVNTYLSDQIFSSLPPETIEALRDEARGLRTGRVEDFNASIYSLGQILKGNTALMDIDPAQRQVALSGVAAAVKGNGKAIAEGRADPIDVDQWTNAYTQVLNIAVDTPMNLTDMKSVYTAVDLIVGQHGNGVAADTWKIFEQRANDPTFQPVIFGSRSAAAKMLRVAQTNGPMTMGNWRLDLNNDGIYVPVRIAVEDFNASIYILGQILKGNTALMDIDPAQNFVNTYLSDQIFSSLPPETIEALRDEARGLRTGRTDNRDAPIRRNAEDPFSPMVSGATGDKVPPQLIQHQKALNSLVNHLQVTSAYDSEVPKGGTGRSLRLHYAKGTPVTTAAGKPVVEPGMSFDAAWDQFAGELRQGAITPTRTTQPQSFKDASISPGDAVSRFSSRGVPKHIAAGIVGNLLAESGLKTGAVGDGGKAMSLAQWHPDRRANAEANGFDLGNPEDALDFVLWELNNTESSAKQRLMKAQTPQEAADAFALYFLRPKGAETGNANNVHNIEGRRRFTQQVYGGD